jgi:hypothetical protein
MFLSVTFGTGPGTGTGTGALMSEQEVGYGSVTEAGS